MLIPNCSHMSRTRALSNCFPLSITIKAGIAKRQMMFFQMKLVVFASVIFANGSASTHFVK